MSNNTPHIEDIEDEEDDDDMEEDDDDMEDNDPVVTFFIVKIGTFERDVGLNVPQSFFNACMKMNLERYRGEYRRCEILAHESLVNHSVPRRVGATAAYYRDHDSEDSVTIVTLDDYGNQDNRWSTFLINHGIQLGHWISVELCLSWITIRTVDPPAQLEVIQPVPFFVTQLIDFRADCGLDIPKIFYEVYVAPQNVRLRVVRSKSGDDSMWVQLFRLQGSVPAEDFNGERFENRKMIPDAVGWYGPAEWEMLLSNMGLKPNDWIRVKLRGTEFVVSKFNHPQDLVSNVFDKVYPSFVVHLESDSQMQEGLVIPQGFAYRTLDEFDVEYFLTRRVRLVERFEPRRIGWDESANDIWVKLEYNYEDKIIRWRTGLWTALLNKQNIRRGDWIRVYLHGYDFVITRMAGPPSPESPPP